MNRSALLRRSGFRPRLPESRERERRPVLLTPIRVPVPSAPIFNPQPKREYVRSSALMFAYSLLACKGCGIDDGSCCGAHSNWSIHGKGKGIKADDNRAASLCATCHHRLDQEDDLDNPEKQRWWWDCHVASVIELQARGFWPPGVPIPDIDNYPEQWK